MVYFSATILPSFMKHQLNNNLGATYDAIEGRFRIIKQEAEALKREIESGVRPPAPSRGSTNTSSATENSETPAKGTRAKRVMTGTPTPKMEKPAPKKEKVLSGRVTKKTTPSKTAKKAVVDDYGMDGFTEMTVKEVKNEASSSGSSWYDGEHYPDGDDAFLGAMTLQDAEFDMEHI